MEEIKLKRKEISSQITLQVKVQNPFGFLNWRLNLSKVLFIFASKILGTKIEINIENEQHS